MQHECILLDLGMKEYQAVWNMQKELVNKRMQKEISDILILVEHPHTITMGRRARPENIISKEIPIYAVERGGDATYHGPGQMVGYPILSIEEHCLDVQTCVKSLEEVILLTLSDFKIKASRNQSYPGVWIDDKKVASIGIALNRWITYHGFALNVCTDLNYFKMINPCGLHSSVMTSMERILGKPIEIEEVKKILIQKFGKVFNVEFKSPEGLGL